ncbi:MAG: metallophosphoesterase [Myxococcales bacterium]|nr:metallophosphoesterase [Myxococcales bacterium]
MPRLLAISDLHLRHRPNLAGLAELAHHEDDWLIIAGDVGDKLDDLAAALDALRPRFARLFWVPGNHDLWSDVDADGAGIRGVDKYERQVAMCRERGVLTPEDPYVEWPGARPPGAERVLVAPLFLLYDYSFHPDEIADEDAVGWSAETGVVCADEMYLRPDPHPSRQAWCAARCQYTERRLAEVQAEGTQLVLINHWPLLQELAWLPRIPRFMVWCGTRRSAGWHTRFRACNVVYGHLHIRRSFERDGVRFDEVSLGYPKQWQVERGIDPYLRQILPPNTPTWPGRRW